MELTEVIRVRRSIRAYHDRPIEAEKVRQLLDLISLAPSAGNLQGYEIYQVTSPSVRAELARASHQPYIAQAPLVLAFFANPGRSARKYGTRGERLYSLQDATIACTYAMLAAADMGLSTVWVGAFADEAVSAAVGAPADWVPVALLPVGYAAETPGPTARRAVSELVHPME
jgi:nitroreductase